MKVLIIVLTQLLFTFSDLLGRFYMTKLGFSFQSFIHPWFIAYFAVRFVAMFGQLYIFSLIELGKTMALFGAVSIMLANILGFLLLKEVLSMPEYAGIALAIVAFLILTLK